MVSKTEGFIEITTGKIHYLEWGRGDQIHLLHANGFCAGVYAPFIKYLSDDYTIVASDIRGHGDSSPVRQRRIRGWEIFAEDLNEFIRKKMNPPVIGIGHSLGGVTTLIAAVKYPDLFSKIVLIDPVIFSPKLLILITLARLSGLAKFFPIARAARRRKKNFSSREEVYQRYSSGRGMFKTWPEEFIESYLDCAILIKDKKTALLKCDPELEAQIFESVPASIWRYAGRVKCPVLAIRGEKSDTFRKDAAERLYRFVPRYDLITIPDAGHFVPMEKPAEVAKAIKAFLGKNDTSKL